MNKAITSKKELLKHAKQIIDEQGTDNLNIRTLAQKANISVGSVYNYFPSKSDLVFSLVESFWNTVFKPGEIILHENEQFVSFIDKLYNKFAKYISKFRDVYTSYMTLMKSSDKHVGKQLEQKYLKNVCKCIRAALDCDKSINGDIWSEKFTKDEFSKFVFDNMFFLLVGGKRDCEYLKGIIERILYS